MKTEASARRVAFTVLHRVVRDAAFASLSLDAEIKRAGLGGRDAALATEIVYGTLRVLPQLDQLIKTHLRRMDERLDDLTHATLRASSYQLLHLGRVPAYATVDDAVAFIGRNRGRPSAGFVNAVLRKIAAQRPDQPTVPGRIAVPDWLDTALDEALGETRKNSLLSSGVWPPPLCLRTRGGDRRDALLADLRRHVPRAGVELGALSPLSLLLSRAGDPRRLPGYAEGRFAVQEEGAQLVALALGARPGETVADVCCGRGGKTGVLAAQVGATGRVTAIDVDEAKLERMNGELARLGLSSVPVSSVAVDLRVGLGGVEPGHDRVLVDAPCTGLGTIVRRPELLLRRVPDDGPRLAALQFDILDRASALVRPGGRLLYAVCSPLLEEGRGVADAFESRHPEMQRDLQSVSGLPSADEDGVRRLGPWLALDSPSLPDVYQVVLWRRDTDGSA